MKLSDKFKTYRNWDDFEGYIRPKNTDQVVITDDGKVGIGTNNPDRPLVIESSRDGIFYINQTNSSITGYVHTYQTFAPNLNTGSHLVIAEGGYAFNPKNSAHIDFYYDGDGSDNNRLVFGLHTVDDVLNILANGNVGIGTVDPQKKLHVNGDTQIDGTLYLPDFSNSSSGYTKLPNGFILQWGSFEALKDYFYEFAFPIAYPNNCLGLWLSHFCDYGGDADVSPRGVWVSNSGFRVKNEGVNSTGNCTWTLYWIAIGY